MTKGKYHHVYFVGIGGIGMSALARYFNMRGVKVSGYDKTESQLTMKLVSEGIDIIYEDNEQHPSGDIDLVVYTPAVPSDLGILKVLEGRGIPVVKRAKLLGIIADEGKSVAVAGTHGKTTTSSVVAHCLKASDLDISAFLGGIMVGYETNYFLGTSEWMVVEADEFDRSFHHLHPDVAIINALDADHLDIYGSQEQFTEAFVIFAEGMKKGGRLLVRDKALAYLSTEQLSTLKQNHEVLSFGTDSENDIVIDITSYAPGGRPIFDMHMKGGDSWRDLQFPFPGLHNVCNACAAAMAAEYVGIDRSKIQHALATFPGVKRRFERIVETDEVVFIDDYAHHPEEIRAVCSAVKEAYVGKKILAVFQPHLYSRTRDFMEEFAEALSGFEEVVLLDIYPAREKSIEGISSKVLADKMFTQVTLSDKDGLIECLRKMKFDVLLTIGAGDIDTKLESIKNWLVERPAGEK